MKIAVCDDEIIFVNRIYHLLWQQPDCTVECFTSPTDLMERYKAGERYDVVFLDVLMEPVNGIELAKEIRKFDKQLIIIFLTSCLDYAPAGYEVQAFRYLLKPIKEDALMAVMKEVRKELEHSHTLMVKTPECDFLVHIEELQYLEADNKDTILYYMGDTIRLRKGLQNLEEELPEEFFFRIHRKYLVNLAHVREFDEGHVTLDCGKTLPISRRKGKEFRAALNAYIEGESISERPVGSVGH